MGVPKFYRWLSERYPCLSEVVKEHQIPEFDNLYLDMNGIIHICSHPNDDDIHFRISEEKIIQDIFHYLEVLFRMIQPRKVFFMAIDGVAPRAKMNQQRGRRFRSAKDAELSEKRARDRGEVLPKEARFDSNCITPGTSFMDRLHQQLKYFVVSKISTDTLWHGVKVILSGHETPGEGEHKIMDYIRYERSKPDYDPDTRHCLYGLDADLIMLGMCTHDPHFSLLREEVRFGGRKTPQKRTTTPEETTFHLLHLSLLREYLDHEFSSIRSTLPFPYSVESIIDDWILLGFLVGNDFLPHLPHLHINKGALTELYDVYKQELPGLGGYINENGYLNLVRFEKFLGALSLREMDRFDDIYSDNKWLEGKTARKQRKKGAKAGNGVRDGFETIITDTPGPATVELLLNNGNTEGASSADLAALAGSDWQTVGSSKKDQDLLRLLQSADELLNDEATSDTDEEDDPFDTDTDVCCAGGRDNQYHMEFRQHKREYYIHKLGYAQVTQEVLREQAEGYVRAIQWNLHYYYNGCQSWSWYYPHHFAPWITDIRNFSNMDLTFEMSKPFQPFEQLLSVLPAASKELLPLCLQNLMCQESSPIIDYYPVDFESDLNGKQQDWEAVVLIPFIDEKRLLEAMEPLMKYLTPDEKRRNSHGPMQVFTYSMEPLGSYPAPQYFPTIDINHAALLNVWREEWEVPEGKLRKGLLPETRLDVFYPGFPTLKHIPHSASLQQANVRVFEQQSRGFNMILRLLDENSPNLEDVASEYLGKEIWVSWPHMVEAKVVAVRNSKQRIFLERRDGQDRVGQEASESGGRPGRDDFFITVKGIAERYKSRWGVEVGDTRIVIEACLMTGRKYVYSSHGKITLEKQWSKLPQSFALQATRKDILVHDPSFTQYRTLPELFPSGSICFMLGQPNYGAQGSVIEVSPEYKGKISLSFVEQKDVDLTGVKQSQSGHNLQYMPGYRAAQILGISSHLLSRITGTVFILRGPKEADLEHAGKVNVGLNLKHNKKNEEVCGFSKRGEDNNWVYSTKTIDALRNYMSRFPEIFYYMAKSGNLSNDMFHHSDVFKNSDGESTLRELSEWIKDQPFSTAARQPCGTLALDEAVVTSIAEAVDEHKAKKETQRQTIFKMHVRPHLLFKPNLSKGGSMPDPDADFQLFDRVVNVRQGFSVPLGLKGTVTGLLQGSKPEDALVEVMFDSEFSGGLPIRCNANRCYRLPAAALINLTFGRERSLNPQQLQQQPGSYAKNKNKPVARVKPLGQQQQQQLQSGGNGRRGQQYHQPAAAIPAAACLEPKMMMAGPPDPKLLPNPNFLFNNSKKSDKKSAETAPAASSNDILQNLWSSLSAQQPQTESTPSFQTPILTQNSGAQQGNRSNADLTNQLKSMLNISNANQSHQQQQQGHRQRQPKRGGMQQQQPRPHLQQQPGSYPQSLPGSYPQLQPGSYPQPQGQSSIAIPQMFPQPPSQPPISIQRLFPQLSGGASFPVPATNQHHVNPNPVVVKQQTPVPPSIQSAMAFVPLQVHMKQTKVKKSAESSEHTSSASPEEPPKSEKASQQQAEAAPTKAPVKPPGQASGGKRTGEGSAARKSRMAATFGPK